MRHEAVISKELDDSGGDSSLRGLLLNFGMFGDVYKTSFDEWYKKDHKKREQWAALEMKDWCAYIDSSFKIRRMLEYGSLSISESLPSVIENQESIKQLLNDPRMPVICLNLNASDKQIHKEVRTIVSKYKAKRSFRPEELSDYLHTYDLRLSGVSWLETAKRVFGGPEYDRKTEMGIAELTIRRYQKNACRIIQNVESGQRFPGVY